ncbi:futalosine hydrolase [Nemorincola caseinilytica]|uniref:Futalosine hydrolase n=1 Tax=Nemorincola caseinilytica TaxID=2054315 RepID=A0ABP8N998_9BACT
MKLLVVAATAAEIAPFLAQCPDADVLITGVGMVATTYALTRRLATTRYDLVIQAGVGGSFDESIPLGEVVFVTADTYGDLGAEDHDEYIDIYGLGLLGRNDHPHTEGMLRNPLSAMHSGISLRQVSGLTVNTVSGNATTIARRRTQGCQVESMEGAAFHYVCLQEGVPFAQVRAISNYVIPRDKSQWKMKDAIIALNNWLIEYTRTA